MGTDEAILRNWFLNKHKQEHDYIFGKTYLETLSRPTEKSQRYFHQGSLKEIRWGNPTFKSLAENPALQGDSSLSEPAHNLSEQFFDSLTPKYKPTAKDHKTFKECLKIKRRKQNKQKEEEEKQQLRGNKVQGRKSNRKLNKQKPISKSLREIIYCVHKILAGAGRSEHRRPGTSLWSRSSHRLVWAGRGGDLQPRSPWECVFPVPWRPRLPRGTWKRKEQSLQRLQREDRRRLHLGVFVQSVEEKRKKKEKIEKEMATS